MTRAVEGLREALLQADAALLRFGNISLQNPLFDVLMPWFDKAFYWWAPIALTVIGVLIWGGKRGTCAALGALVVVILCDQISSSVIKPLVGRIRPCNVLAGLHLWKDGGWLWLPQPVVEIYRTSYSFPSSHAANTASQAVWWGWAYPRYKWVGIGFALLIGYSRVYDGVHWPTDVAGGWLLGGGVGLIIVFITRRWIGKWESGKVGRWES